MMYLEMLIGGLMGIALQTLVKVYQMNRRLPLENYVSVFKMYWQKDVGSVLISFVTVAAAVFISSEWLDGKIYGYVISSYIKTMFIVVGYCANSIVGVFLGRTEKILKDKEAEK